MSEPSFTVDRYGGTYSVTFGPHRWWTPRGLWARVRNPHYVRDFNDAGSRTISEVAADAAERFGLVLSSDDDAQRWARVRERELRIRAIKQARAEGRWP